MICSYTSSLTMKMRVSATISVSAAMSCSESTAPEGLWGELRMMSLVFGVIESFTRSQSIE